MEEILIYIPEGAAATAHAAKLFHRWGFSVTTLPCPRMTHVLLGVPCQDMPKLPAETYVSSVRMRIYASAQNRTTHISR